MRQGTKRILPVSCLVLVLALSWVATDVRADDLLDGWLHIDPRDWELTTEFDGAKRSADGAVTKRTDYEEGLRVRQNGYILDPGIATFTLGQHLVFEQGKTSPAEGSATSRAATFADYDASFSLLHGTVIPVTISGFATRDSGALNDSEGSRTDFVNQSRDLGVYYKTPYFPSSIRYSEQIRNQTVTSGLSNRVSATDDILRTIGIQGKSTKMQMSLDLDQFTDNASVEDRDFVEATANVSHLFRWGKGSQLNTRTTFRNRTGFNPQRKFNIDEYVKLKHSSKLESTYEYRYSNLIQATDTVTHYGSVELIHRLYKNLITTLNFTASDETVDTSQENEYLGKVDLDYQKGILWNGTLSSSAGFGYGLMERVSSGELLLISDESHDVSLSSIVQLKQRFISTGTIVVTDLAGTTFYTEGLDYTVVSVSGDHIELQILGGGLIAVGQTILIDYRYLPAPTMKNSQIPYNFRIGLDFGWISVFEQLSGTKYALISGEDGTFLNDEFDSKTGVKLKWTRPDFEANAAADYQHSTSGALKTNRINLNQGLSYILRRDASLNAGASQTFVISDGRLTEVYSANVSGSWTPSRGLFIRPFLNATLNKSEASLASLSDAINDTLVNTGFSVRWRVRAIDVNLRYNHDYRTGTTTNADEDRLRISVSRKF